MATQTEHVAKTEKTVEIRMPPVVLKPTARVKVDSELWRSLPSSAKWLAVALGFGPERE